MKKVLFFFLLTILLISPIQSVFADVWVNGYTRSNGTYVNGYYRSSPDSSPYNNFSYPGNTNPYTGVTAGGSASSYLNNYYNSSGNSYSPPYTSSYSYSPPYTSSYSSFSTPSCPVNSYSSGSSCKCNYGYVVDGGKCVYADTLCRAQIGTMSSYDSLNNSCKCSYGYVIGSSGICTYKSSTATYGSYSPSDYSSYSAYSNESLTDPDMYTWCDTGYQLDKEEHFCVKIPAKTNNKICRTEFGNKSKWDGTYADDNEPYCECKNNYEWNEDGTSCVKF